MMPDISRIDSNYLRPKRVVSGAAKGCCSYRERLPCSLSGESALAPISEIGTRGSDGSEGNNPTLTGALTGIGKVREGALGGFVSRLS
jgi:hypothetical protein